MKRWKAIKDRFWSKVLLPTNSDCWLWVGACAGHMGYGHFNGGDRGFLKAHRFSREIHFGPIPAGMMVLHKCDNPRCVNPDHLFLGNASDNMLDCSRKGRIRIPHKSGEANNTAKLTNEQADCIRKMPGLHRDIAAKFGVNRSTVSAIKRGERYVND